ncbi:MAG: hypothetical protein IPK01_16105 [Acidobacteria bacterium]|nr:hypothetical protein [Acidobacteriota bacterium]
MKFISRNLSNIAAAMFTLVIGVTATAIFGQPVRSDSKAYIAEHKSYQREFCSNNNWSNDDNVSVRDLRETTIPSSSEISVDGNRNGGVSVKGEDRSDVLVRACVQAWAKTEAEAKAIADGVKINTSQTIKADNSVEEKNWSVSYEIRVPRNTNLNLTAHNGGISISDVNGAMSFETTNGSVSLIGLYGSVKGRTTNGGVNIKLTGRSWNGSGLEVTTSNGGVNLMMSKDYSANVETGTINGGYKTEIPALAITTEDIKGDYYRPQNKTIQTNLNGGGAPIKVTTTNGGVRISTFEDNH